ncbi:hypothetical protein HMPREF9209_1442 [Lactobacillus gasseri 224-1]|uniref:Hydrolase, haloacid dehalogenase-like family protein n=1 Tax=Lactobacillus gasseri 224-1 TaxID=679196 RepID=D1YGP2_LACGS|nr:hypothetical protein HMPREF9209_1442 [Lactobacillus gasseri 224-1]
MTKLIAVDMDGTFLRDDKSYDEEKFANIYQELEKEILCSQLLVVINIIKLLLF